MEHLRKEIIVTFENLMHNLDLDYEVGNIKYLAREDIYLEIFATMFPMLRKQIIAIASKPEHSKGERIQNLIEFLSVEILNLDLSHIRGSLIADGDLKHILNFLQLLLEISKMFLQKKQTDDGEEYSEEPTDSRKHKGRKSHEAHSEGDVPEESGEQQDEEEYEGEYGDEEEEEEQLDEEDLMDGADPNMDEIVDVLNRPKKGYGGEHDRHASGGQQPPPGSQSDGVSRISEVSKSKESSEFDSIHKKFSSRQKAGGSHEDVKSSQKKKARSFDKQPEEYERYDYGYGQQGGHEGYDPAEYEGQRYEGEEEEEEEEEYDEEEYDEGQIDPDDLRYNVEDKDYMRLVQRGPGSKKLGENYQREHYEAQQGEDEEAEVHQPVSRKKGVKRAKGVQKVNIRPLNKAAYGREQGYPTKQARPVKKQGKRLRPKTAGNYEQRRAAEEEGTALHHSESKRHLQTIDEMNRAKIAMQGQADDEEGIPEEDEEEQAQGSEEYDENAGDHHNIQEAQEEFQDENMLYSILSKNIKHVRSNLENLRSSYLPDDEPKTRDLILQQKNSYKSYLNQYLNDHKIKDNKSAVSTNVNEKNFAHSVKAQILSDQKLDESLDNQQKSLFLKLRDEKINYLRKIHKIVFELEKKKLIEEKKEQMEVRKSKNEQTRLVVESIQNMYKNKLTLLREKQTNDEQERRLVQNAQKKMLRDLQKEIKSNKTKEIDSLKNKWNSEKEKFESLMQDNGYLEEKIMKVYKRFN